MAARIDLNTALDSPESTKVVAAPFGVATKVVNDDVTEAAPTDAELDAAFGTPATLGEGFIGIINDNAASTDSILCWTVDGAWFHVLGTLSS